MSEVVPTDDQVLHFPDRSLLKLINGIDGVLAGKISPETLLKQCDDAMQAIGAVRDATGEWRLPEPAQPTWKRGGDLVGTHRVGTLQRTYDDIVSVFGEPGEGDGNKVCFEWCITFEDGTVASIYDYKASTLYDSEGWKPSEIRQGKFTEWSIGGKTERAAQLVKELFP